MKRSGLLAQDVFDGLTPNQRRVLSLIARRRSAKEIAIELSISPSRVSQYVRTLKDRFGVETLSGLADVVSSLSNEPLPYKELPCKEFHLPPTPEWPQSEDRPGPGVFQFSDVGMASATSTDWMFEQEIRIVPEALDGSRAVGVRMVYMVAVAIGLPLALIILITAMTQISAVLSPPA